MSDPERTASATSLEWEARQKNATFYQGLLGSPQQAAIASNATSALVLTVGLGFARFSNVGSDDWAIAFVVVVGWLLLMAVLTVGFAKSAVRIRSAYQAEHAERFPGAPAYRLESFLLDFADHHAFLFRDRSGADKSVATLTSGQPITV